MANKIHGCGKLKVENAKRRKEHEPNIAIFEDYDDGKDVWVINVWQEYILISFCPFCGKELNG